MPGDFQDAEGRGRQLFSRQAVAVVAVCVALDRGQLSAAAVSAASVHCPFAGDFVSGARGGRVQLCCR